MRPSFVRLVVRSVLLTWALSSVLLAAYVSSRSWDEDAARRDGIFLIHESLDRTPATLRADRLTDMQRNTYVELSLVAVDEVERRIGRPVQAGERIPHADSWRRHWYYAVFEDGRSALAAGPVNPAVPSGVFPIGVLFAFLMVPVIVGVIALRVERSIIGIERASDAIAVGEFGARAHASAGPSEELAARFNAMAERIERLVRSRNELVQAVSHELGSPLSRLRFHVELLDREPPEQRADRVAAMSRELDALDELVGELLGYVQSDNFEIERELFDPARVLGDLAELARLEAAEERGMSVDVYVAEGVRIDADPRLFQRAVENVLRNAVRHAKTQVRVDVRIAGDGAHVAIHDDGPGIPEDQRDKVITPFYRVGAERDRRTGGVGLGLAIVHRIVARHGGSVEIDASPLGGALVTTRWPGRA